MIMQQIRLLSSVTPRSTILLSNAQAVPIRRSANLKPPKPLYYSTKNPMSESTFYTLKAKLPSGEVYDFAQLKGKTVLIVNVASQWYVYCLRLMDTRNS
jgi:hypothetical protein